MAGVIITYALCKKNNLFITVFNCLHRCSSSFVQNFSLDFKLFWTCVFWWRPTVKHVQRRYNYSGVFLYYPTFSDVLNLRKISGLITFTRSTFAISQERVDFPANILFLWCEHYYICLKYKSHDLLHTVPMLSMEGFWSNSCRCAYTCVLLSEPNNSFTSTTTEHGFAIARIPVNTFATKKDRG